VVVRKLNRQSMVDHADGERTAGRWSLSCCHLRQRMLISRWLVLLLPGVGAAVLNFYHLGAPSLWFDEVLSVERASQSLSVLWHIVNASQPNMALYYFVLHYWLTLTAKIGVFPTETVVRLPSALCALGASVLLFLLARRFLGLAAGAVAVFLYICNDFQLVYAQETRAYALQVLCLIAGWYALLRALTCEQHRRYWFACYIAAMVLAVYTHYFSLLLLLAQGIAIVTLLVLPTPWRARVRLLFGQCCISFLIITLLIAPMLYASHVGAQTGWIPVPVPKDVIRLFKDFSDGNRLYLGLIALLVGAGLLLSVRGAFARNRDSLKRGTRTETPASRKDAQRYGLLLGLSWMLLCWLWVPIVASYLLSQRSLHLFLPRYLISVVPAFCLLAACGLVAMPWRWLRLLLTSGLLLFALPGLPRYYASAQVEEWRTSALWIEHEYRSGDGLICFDGLQGCQIGLEYYFHAYPGPAHFDANSPGTFSYVRYDLQRPAYRPDVEQALDTNAIQRYALQHSRLFYIVARIPDARKLARVAAVISWLNGHCQVLGNIKTSTVTVYLYRIQQRGISRTFRGFAGSCMIAYSCSEG
jgi:4-amino-4-deoxy-L-arabinose transferase-like glycosyltransferase